MTTPSNPAPSIGDLSTLMQQLGQSGDVSDLQLSEGARDAYTKALSDYQNQLSAARDQAAGLVDYGSVGTFDSANQTRGHQVDNVATLVAALDDHISLMADAQNAIRAIFNRHIAHDQNS